jgi:TolA-binding protein
MTDQQQHSVHPELRPYVEAARGQRAATKVTAQDVRAGWERSRTRRRVGAVAGIASLAAAAAVMFMTGPISGPGVSESQVAAQAQADPSSSPAVERAAPAQPESGIPSNDEHEAPLLALADAVHVEARGEWPEATVLGAWELELQRGRYGVTVAENAEAPLTVRLAAKRLEIVEGEVLVDTTGTAPVVILRSGVASWVSDDGRREALTVESVALEKRAPTASQLARAAEKRMAAGDDAGAIAALQQLLRAHPRAAPSRAATFDLGRLLERRGRKDEARCAYESFIDRWPSSDLRRDVERKLERLGEGPACRGMKPRR